MPSRSPAGTTTGDTTDFPVCADADRLRRFAAVIGETRPLYVDEDAAQRAGYRSLPLPPSFLFGLALEPGQPFPWFAEVGFDLPRVLHGEQLFTYHAMPCAGDLLWVRPRITEIYDKPERGLRFVVRETRILGEHGEPIADLRGVFIQPDAARSPSPREAAPSSAPAATPPEPARGAVWHEELRLPPITRSTLARFGESSGDLNPIHLDPAFARRAGFDDVFAQGMLSAAYIGRLLTRRVPQDRLRELRVRFTGRTLLGEAPVCAATAFPVVDALPESLDRRIALRVTNQAGEARLVGEALTSPAR